RFKRQQHAPHPTPGGQLTPSGLSVRALRPGAERMSLLLDGSAPIPMTQRHQAGLFEALVEGRKDVPQYQLEVHYPGDKVFTLRHPYSFLPTIGEMDLYLWGEGKHDRVWEKFGAHVREMDGVSGVSFVVWAPNARGVSVVGDFNGWDGRLHMMRMLGNSGVWE